MSEGLLPPDTIVRGYRVARVLRAGQSNNVYVGVSPTGQEVAIKEYFPRRFSRRLASGRIGVPTRDSQARFEAGVKGFVNEAIALAEIKSDLLARYVVAFRENGTAYLMTVMEPGETLETWARRLIRLGTYPNESDLRLIFWCLLHAVQVMHDRGFLHLDIKPSNVVMRDEFTPVLIDLGGARRFPFNPGIHHVSVSNYTPGFAAPEQHQEKSHDLCPATDIYGIGASIVYCMSGRIPPLGLERLQTDSLSDLLKKCEARYSREFVEIVEGCLRVELGQRSSNIKILQNVIASR